MDHEGGPGPALLLHLLWLLPHAQTAPQDLQNHTFQHTMYCQDWSPNVGLSEAYDEDLLFSFDFSQNTRVPRLPEFADWAQKPGDSSNIFFDKAFCQAMVQEIGPKLEGQIPVSRGLPVAEVFTLKPLEFGKPNTLVCFVSNLFPPTLTVTWQHHAAPVEGAGPTFVSAINGLSFQAFSYLNFTPSPSDLFSCLVTHEIDGYTAIAYWVPHNPLPSDLLENVLCGLAFGLGVLGIVVGLVLIVCFRRPCSERDRKGEGEIETSVRNIDWLPPACPLSGIKPTTLACALTGNRTRNLSVHGMTANQLSHTLARPDAILTSTFKVEITLTPQELWWQIR